MSKNGTRTVDNRKPSQSVIDSQQMTEDTFNQIFGSEEQEPG